MILKAKHHPIIYPFFQKYVHWKIKKAFNSVIIDGNFLDRNLPVLVISNHSSWWDGFWIYILNHRLLKRKFHFMMLEEQLKRYWYFNYCGGFSIKKNSKTIFETFNYTVELLNDSNNLVLIFPQGKIQSMHNHRIEFEKGIERIIKKLDNEISILFVVNLIDYLSNPKPTLYQYIEEYNYDEFDFDDFKESYQNFFQRCIIKQSLLYQ